MSKYQERVCKHCGGSFYSRDDYCCHQCHIAVLESELLTKDAEIERLKDSRKKCYGCKISEFTITEESEVIKRSLQKRLGIRY